MVHVDRLRFVDLVHSFGRRRVLAGVSGEVEAGALLEVVGPNGSGKSTLLRCLAGLLRPQAGTIEQRQNGAVLAIEERRRRVGYLAPELELYGELTARENLSFFSTLRQVPPRLGSEALERFGVPPDVAWKVLSSGQRQRARWALAVLAAPRLLVLDEPLEHLDSGATSLVLDLLQDHLAAGGLAVVAGPAALTGSVGGSRALLRLDAPVAG